MKPLFPDLEPEPRRDRPFQNLCVAGIPGKGPQGETCGSCKHIVEVSLASKSVFKCGLMRHHWTGGAGSDIRKKWPACEAWEKP